MDEETAAEEGAEFPFHTDSSNLCVYDESGPWPATLVRATVPAGGTCGLKPCWTASGTGFKYVDKTGTAAGITRIALKAGAAGKANVSVKGKGANLPVGSLPLALPLPLTVQLQLNGECWAASYSAAGVKTNAEGQFKGKSQ